MGDRWLSRGSGARVPAVTSGVWKGGVWPMHTHPGPCARPERWRPSSAPARPGSAGPYSGFALRDAECVSTSAARPATLFHAHPRLHPSAVWPRPARPRPKLGAAGGRASAPREAAGSPGGPRGDASCRGAPGRRGAPARSSLLCGRGGRRDLQGGPVGVPSAGRRVSATTGTGGGRGAGLGSEASGAADADRWALPARAPPRPGTKPRPPKPRPPASPHEAPPPACPSA